MKKERVEIAGETYDEESKEDNGQGELVGKHLGLMAIDC